MIFPVIHIILDVLFYSLLLIQAALALNQQQILANLMTECALSCKNNNQ